MESQTPFLIIKANINLDQIRIDAYSSAARTLARTRLHLIDFEKMKRLRNVDRQVAEREYMLMKMGMFETWEILYNYD